jgi:heme-binding NEAT domain protein
MKKRFSLVLAFTAIILTFSLITSPVGTVFAEIADGSYQINYEMKEASSDNTSIADGYFSKPATLTVKDGVKYVQLTVTSSSMIKSLSAPSGAVDVVSEGNNDTRTVKFRVDGDLSQPLSMQMHVVVPDMYDTTHTARAVFNVSGLPSASEGASTGERNESSSNDGSVTPVDNPPTADETPIALYITLLLGSIAIFTVYKLRVAKN